MFYVKLYLCSLVLFLSIDYVWLALLARDFYVSQLGHLMRSQILLWVAGVFYMLNTVGLLFFAVLPALRHEKWQEALLFGAMYGFFTYAAYDFTNLATLKQWPLLMTFVDLLWGTAISAMVSLLAYHVARYLR